jgi:RNA polymerase sigma-70 factor (ECF subfamily)
MKPMASEPASDEDLTRRARHGDTAAFDILVGRYQKEIYRIARRITGSHAEADDLAQETFCRAWTGLSGFRGDSSFRTWLHRIVSNLSLNVVQSARVARREESSVEELALAGNAATVQAAAAPAALLERERRERLIEAVRDLPPRQRLTLTLRVFEQMPYAEIARVTGCTVGTAKANMFHAVAALRRALEEKR